MAARYLIVNADDFGLSPGVNRGIIEAHEHGIVTSASLMVRWPAAGEPVPEAISVEGLVGVLAELPPGVTELACHAGDGDDLDSAYRAERAREVRTLCDPRARAALLAAGIELRSFHSLYPGGRS